MSDRTVETVGSVRCKDLIVPSLDAARTLATVLMEGHGFELDPYAKNELSPIDGR